MKKTTCFKETAPRLAFPPFLSGSIIHTHANGQLAAACGYEPSELPISLQKHFTTEYSHPIRGVFQ